MSLPHTYADCWFSHFCILKAEHQSATTQDHRKPISGFIWSRKKTLHVWSASLNTNVYICTVRDGARIKYKLMGFMVYF
jgi:hypothetical protein